jgi:hypothetical protein
MVSIHGLAVSGLGPCKSCKGADTCRVEESSTAYKLRCRKCHADRGKLPEIAIKLLRDTVRVFGTPPEPVFLPRAIFQKGSAMKRDDLFPSKYFKAADLGGKPITVAIKAAAVEGLKNMQGGTEDKLVLSFVGQQKALVVNRTNYDAIAELYGDETDNWSGKRIELYPDKARVGGKPVDCVRVRATAADAFNDEIPH